MWGTVWGPDEEAFPIGLTLEHETAKAKANRPPPPPPLSLFFFGKIRASGPHRDGVWRPPSLAPSPLRFMEVTHRLFIYSFCRFSCYQLKKGVSRGWCLRVHAVRQIRWIGQATHDWFMVRTGPLPSYNILYNRSITESYYFQQINL